MVQLIVILLFLITCLAVDLRAQAFDDTVTVSATVNGESIDSDKLKLSITAGERTLKPRIIRGQFLVNLSEFTEQSKENIRLRISYKCYVVEFTDLTASHFRGSWKIIVFKPKTRSEDIPDPEAVSFVYSVEFNSGDSLGTVRSKIVYKQND